MQQSVPVTNTPGVNSQLMRRPDPTAPPQANAQPPAAAPPQAQANVPLPFEDPVAFAQHLASVRGPNGEQISGGFLQSSLANNIATKKAILAMPAEEQAAEAARLVPVRQMLESVAQAPDDQSMQQKYADVLPQIRQLDPHFAANLPPTVDRNTVNMALALGGQLQAHLEAGKTVAEAKASAANAGKTIAETPGAEAESEKRRLITDAMKNGSNCILNEAEQLIRDALHA